MTPVSALTPSKSASQLLHQSEAKRNKAVSSHPSRKPLHVGRRRRRRRRHVLSTECFVNTPKAILCRVLDVVERVLPVGRRCGEATSCSVGVEELHLGLLRCMPRFLLCLSCAAQCRRSGSIASAWLSASALAGANENTDRHKGGRGLKGFSQPLLMKAWKPAGFNEWPNGFLSWNFFPPIIFVRGVCAVPDT